MVKRFISRGEHKGTFPESFSERYLRGISKNALSGSLI